MFVFMLFLFYGHFTNTFVDNIEFIDVWSKE